MPIVEGKSGERLIGEEPGVCGHFLKNLQTMANGWVVVLFLIAGCQPETPKTTVQSADFILAFSWQPAFCEIRPRKKECKSQTAERYDASRFSLHGLWPQPRNNVYCSVNKQETELDKQGKWLRLKPLELHPETRKNLEKVMPGYQSGLHRHEWVKHGTCYETGDAETYYTDSIRLMQSINQSELARLFADNVGNHLTTRTIRSVFDSSFGEGAGKRIRVKCSRDKNSDRRLIVELTLALAGPISKSTKVSELIHAAKPDVKEGCPGGIVDGVGLQ